MFELKVYAGKALTFTNTYVNALIPLMHLAKDASRDGMFAFSRAECWYQGVKQWTLEIH